MESYKEILNSKSIGLALSGGLQGLAHAGDAKILEEININQKLLAQVRVAL
jgi:predicted acylesterase/phospholipase RssA